jgi:uroporphyrinogen decarboxylase
VILFAKGMASHQEALLRTGARAFAADHGVDLATWKATLPADVTVQGNLDPDWMTREPERAAGAADELLESMRPFSRYIFNLGHGITPQARPETVQAVLERVDAAGQDSPS